jgi:NTE family protein
MRYFYRLYTSRACFYYHAMSMDQHSRRDFLKLCISSAWLAACSRMDSKRYGLALGGGGAKGLAHILMFEALEELGIRPHRIAGTSIGAVMGVMYAAGMRSNDILEVIDSLTVAEGESWIDSLFNEKVLKFFDFLSMRNSSGGLVSTQGFVEFLLETIGKTRFSELQIPLEIVATNFWERKPVVFSKGDLGPAIAASIAIPGFFAPVQYQGKVLVDGGLVNPVPWDLLLPKCDITIAVDVIGEREHHEDKQKPSYFETTFNAFQIMQATINREKRQHHPPQIYIKPDIKGIRVLEFYKFEEIFEQSQAAKAKLKRKIQYPFFERD